MENILGTNLDRIVILAYFAVVMGFGAYLVSIAKRHQIIFLVVEGLLGG
jgi:hypothetical protein